MDTKPNGLHATSAVVTEAAPKAKYDPLAQPLDFTFTPAERSFVARCQVEVEDHKRRMGAS